MPLLSSLSIFIFLALDDFYQRDHCQVGGVVGIEEVLGASTFDESPLSAVKEQDAKGKDAARDAVGYHEPKAQQ